MEVMVLGPSLRRPPSLGVSPGAVSWEATLSLRSGPRATSSTSRPHAARDAVAVAVAAAGFCLADRARRARLLIHRLCRAASADIPRPASQTVWDEAHRSLVGLALAAGLAISPVKPAIAAQAVPVAAAGSEVTASAAPVDSSVVEEVYGSYVELLELVDKGSITRVDIYDQGKTAVGLVVRQGHQYELVVELPSSGPTPHFIDRLQGHDITISVHTDQISLSTMDLVIFIAVQSAIPFLFTGSVLWGISEKLGAVRRSTAQVQVTPQTGVTFADVAGIDEAKLELSEVVDFLRAPERFVRLGARIPRGVVLAGPPGTGKTLMAKALAGEAGVPLINASASEFVEVFVGVGASRVRDVFRKAREHAPCIIFIDELDAVGSARSHGSSRGRSAAEREQTLNQLLTEMDGFSSGQDGHIIVVAATNRLEGLDTALLRPGRFDRRIVLELPDLQGRHQILNVHAAGKKLAPAIDLDSVARRTAGFSGAELANLLNEAAILAARSQRAQIEAEDVDGALDRVTVGIRKHSLADSDTKRVVAYHEAGHALVSTLLPHHDHVHKVTLVRRGSQSSLTQYEPKEEQSLVSLNMLRAQITSALGGRAAEQLIFGEEHVTTGARDDLQRVEELARSMVTRFGMSEAGTVAVDVGSSWGPRRHSEHLAGVVDGAIHNISKDCFQRALLLLREQRTCLDRIASELLEQETISGDRLREIVAEFTQVPDRLHI